MSQPTLTFEHILAAGEALNAGSLALNDKVRSDLRVYRLIGRDKHTIIYCLNASYPVRYHVTNTDFIVVGRFAYKG